MAKESIHPELADQDEPIKFSNAVRLSGLEWLGVGIFTVLLLAFAPKLWKQHEGFFPGPDYRLPHDLGNDYWLFERYAGWAAERYDTVLLGDSVVWGEYVKPDETLSHYLNRLADQELYGNLALDGAAPLALEGLIDHYAGSIRNKNVVLHCNLLWLSSLKSDMQDEDANITHPRLIPQGYKLRAVYPDWPFIRIVSRIPALKTDASERIGVKVEQHVPFNSWTTHLQQAYYDRTSMPAWTLEHPYENPLAPLRTSLPDSDSSSRHLPIPWFKAGIGKQDYPWVESDESWQWTAFQRVVHLLKARGNRVFVFVGPFNEHIMEPGSLNRFQELKSRVGDWLEAQQIPHALLSPLPSDLYGDASHPLAAGYAMLAKQLSQAPNFRP